MTDLGRPGPTPAELPAAVVNVLLGDGEVTPKAIGTTALDLVRAGRLRSERKADGTLTVRPLPGADGLRPLRPFEELLIQRVVHRRAPGVDRVPTDALGPGDGDAYWVWWRGFQQSVSDEAMSLGLIRPARKRSRVLLIRSAAVAAWFGLLSAGLLWNRHVFAVIITMSFNAVLISPALSHRFPIRTRPRLTTAGRQAARWWRDNDAAAEHRLPRSQVGAEGPESALPVREARRIWSSYGRSWHVVDTAPLEQPRWGHLWQLVLLAVGACAATLTLALTVHLPHGAALDASPALVGAIAAALWLPARRRVLAVPDESTFRGAVIARWDYSTSYDDPPTRVTHYCCSLEDPAAQRAWSFQVNEWRRSLFSDETNPALADRFRVGDVVDVHCSPRRRRVYRISVAEAVPR
ncbi:DUF2207 domain-containing protein [Streptomyces sp. NBC_00377]|uniref:hypothetical protein n=1 Tax=unclassified Streptomyces TaxID=2593676 RepID=UPI002E2217AD|nr:MULTISPECIES: hypothetical protein [unclassified Streptomyces]